MFTIQYRDTRGGHAMQNFDSRSRSALIRQLARFERPIVAVYEQATVITKAARKELREYRGDLSPCAREFLTTLR